MTYIQYQQGDKEVGHLDDKSKESRQKEGQKNAMPGSVRLYFVYHHQPF